MTRTLLLAIGLLTLGSCGQAPRPFEHQTAAKSDLLVLKDRGGIFVAPLAGDLPHDPELLARIMAKRLRDLNVPATTRVGNGESRYLHGWVAQKTVSAAPDILLVEWELWDMDGRLIGGYTQHQPLSGITGPGGGAFVEALAAEAAPKIAALVQEPPVAEARIRGFPGARLVVTPLDTGPGDSKTSLVRALRAELEAAGLPISAQEGPRDILILGRLTLGPAHSGQEEIAITWSVVGAWDNKDLGRIDQRNHVPAGSLDGAWGATAAEVAREAAAGILDLLNRAARS